MDLQIRTNGTRVTDGMREFIDRRMSKLDTIADKVVDAQLELRTETTRSGASETTAQLTLQTGKHVLRAEEKAADASKAIDAAIDKLIVQVRKFNDKRVRRRRRSGEHPMAEMARLTESDFAELGQSPADGAAAMSDEDDEDEEEPSLRVKRFSIKPMHVEEAIDQMELLGHDFFLFQNGDEDQMNVVYKRRDGAYGLLAPEKR